MNSIDLNCDMGESFGAWRMGDDEALMEWVSSVNVACGFHAGDASVIRTTVELALKKDIAIGAHPGYPDLPGFGRRSLRMSPREVYDVVLYQIAALHGMVNAAGGKLRHVKPHGALYNDAAVSPSIASAIAMAIRDLDRALVLVGLAGSALVEEAEKIGLKAAREGFADRTYSESGLLTPRSEKGALIDDVTRASAQALMMANEQRVISTSGRAVSVEVDTVCIHGDGAHAVLFAREIANTLQRNGITVKSF